jgi:hypothetical protein
MFVNMFALTSYFPGGADSKLFKLLVNMALKLERGDLLQLEPISFPGTLKLFPLGKKNKVLIVSITPIRVTFIIFPLLRNFSKNLSWAMTLAKSAAMSLRKESLRSSSRRKPTRDRSPASRLAVPPLKEIR